MTETRRGRPKHGESAKKAALHLTTTPELRELLARVAAEKGRSITREVEERLAQSFELTGSAKDARDASLLAKIASLIAMIESRMGLSWKENQAVFEAVVIGISQLVQRHNPFAYSESWKAAQTNFRINPDDPEVQRIADEEDEPFREAQKIGKQAADFIDPAPLRHSGLIPSFLEE